MLSIAGVTTARKKDDHASLFQQPCVLAEGLHWFALYKPPFWEVSVESKEAQTDVATVLLEDVLEEESNAKEKIYAVHL